MVMIVYTKQAILQLICLDVLTQMVMVIQIRMTNLSMNQPKYLIEMAMAMAIIKVAYLVMHVHQNMVSLLEIPMAVQMLILMVGVIVLILLIMIHHSGMIPIETAMVTN